jgi:allantoin racemase
VKRILVVNSNTSKAATQRIANILEPHAREDTAVTCVNVQAGPEGIDTLLDVLISGLETVRVITANRYDYDAYIIACGDDPGLDAARQVTDRPVIGIAEAAMLTACPLGSNFSILTASRAEIPRITQLVDRYGLRSRLASVSACAEMSTAEIIGDLNELYQRFLSAARRAIEEDMAEVILLTGSVMGGLEDKMSQELGVPVLSGIVCALKLAESMTDLNLRTSQRYKYHSIDKHDELVGYQDLVDVYSA